MALDEIKTQIESVESEPMSLEELEAEIQSFRSICNEKKLDPPIFLNSQDTDFEKKVGDWNSKHEELIQSLLERKDRFDKIFTTESGSLYFVLNTGESLRIKVHPQGEDDDGVKPSWYAVQPMMEGVAFLPRDYSVEKAIEFIRMPDMKRIEVGDMEIGSRPLEWSPIYWKQHAVVKREGKDLLFVGVQEINGEVDENSKPAFHPGHTITKIIK